ncbi:hypothetical protein GVN20_19395, partial [Runella sp. CRIBMP]|nr:hypothetical protein [Runella sp. CRIBMP]
AARRNRWAAGRSEKPLGGGPLGETAGRRAARRNRSADRSVSKTLK